jgi:hypothetical protein
MVEPSVLPAKRGRGRPRKTGAGSPDVAENGIASDSALGALEAVPVTIAPVKRGKGRPRKKGI